MEQSESIAELTKALLKARVNFKPLVTDKTNPHFKSKYASLQACLEATEGALQAEGLVVEQLLEPGPDGMMALTTQVQHSSGEWQRSTGYLPTAQSSPQSGGSSLTYLRRYAYSALLGLAADEDDDGNAAAKTEPKQEAPVNPAGYIFPIDKRYKGKKISEVPADYLRNFILGDSFDKEDIREAAQRYLDTLATNKELSWLMFLAGKAEDELGTETVDSKKVVAGIASQQKEHHGEVPAAWFLRAESALTSRFEHNQVESWRAEYETSDGLIDGEDIPL